MSNTPSDCNERAALSATDQRTFDAGWACGYAAGVKQGEKSSHVTRMSQRYIPLAAASGVLIGVIATLLFGR